MSRPRRGGSPGRVVLYTKDDCSLCDKARAVLDTLGVAYETAWDDAYVWRIPVVERDGEIVAEGLIDEGVLRRAFGRRTARRVR